ncbi:MAG: phosphatase PAP2 family protein [Alphaproteobacteria bacterium]|nr:phosphatase PAP2 family protein [Alphaproteobacteria bacterium]MDE2111989.1 phosphatase PAP2 family protein [Alphaproteobacteria bacterium]MDE2492553.1 phosphatase PAP2 family protein [Alphaproteobacteria bacterium]
MKSGIVAVVLVVLLSITLPARASSNDETIGKDVAVALPVIAGGITVWRHDWTGLAQLAVSGIATVGTVYGLKQIVRECRPFAEPCTHNGGNWNSFPSGTSAVAFVPAQFLWQRYGWEYGLPAYAAAAYVGYSRVESKEHHWWDVVASAAISVGYNEIFTTPYRPRGFYSDLSATPDGVYASLHYRW